MKDKKKIVIGLLCTMVCIMAVGYALLAQQLNINGRTSIDSTWRVEITNIEESEVTGSAVSKVTPSYTSTTANFSVGLTSPGDSITYNVEISNLGTLNAKVDSINIVMDENDAIKYTTTGIKSGDKLASGEKTTLTVKVEYDSNITSPPTKANKDITVTINYIQDIAGETDTPTYQTYSIGDKIEFAGSNWYVIKDSSSDEEYVTLLKEKVLTNAELGSYATTSTYDTMSYYWSDTCHQSGFYGYTDTVTSGCEGHNDYEGSKVKEFLEGTYINTLGSDNLKNIDGYKIRLITRDEINTNLGWDEVSGTPHLLWVHQNFGEKINNVEEYWIMTASNNINVLTVYYKGSIFEESVQIDLVGVRPVINLLKSSI